MFFNKIKKRDGKITLFDPSIISNAVHRAFLAVELEDGGKAADVTSEVVKKLQQKLGEEIPSVEDVQDMVGAVLENKGYGKVAKEYLDFREKKEELRNLRTLFGIEPKLTVNALEVLKARYLLRDTKKNIVETPSMLFQRVADALAKVDTYYNENAQETKKIFFSMMTKLEFIPNSPTLFNAGTDIGQLSACFVLPVADSLDSIFSSLKNMALIEQTGGGVGFDFSSLRPKGDFVRSTMGIASGPVSFMHIFDSATNVIKAGGKRRGAMMGILRVDHPDIIEFINAKQNHNYLSNFNLSVAITDDFVIALEKDEFYWLVNPRNKEQVKQIQAREIWDLIAHSAWANGEPGIIFIDEINRHNPTPKIGKIESTNPCGELPLLPYESCNLGSINLSRMVDNEEINWEKLRDTVRNAVHFLDNVVDANIYPLKEISDITQANRKIGLGVMGFADMLIMLGVPYDSDQALEIGEKVMEFIEKEAHQKSVEIAEKRGSFLYFKGSIWENKYKSLRNATLTTIAPTGTISIIAGCSSGIEPLFAVSFMRLALGGRRLFEINPVFEQIAKQKGFYNAKLLEEIARTGSVQNIDGVSDEVKRVFVTALDIDPVWHVKMQAAFQKYTDNAVSKTVNLPNKATLEDVRKIFELAWKSGCKGVTVFRYGSKPEQVLYVGEIKAEEGKFISAQSDFAGGCPTSKCSFPV